MPAKRLRVHLPTPKLVPYDQDSLDRGPLQVAKRATEMFEHVTREQGLFARTVIEQRELSRASTSPCPNPRTVEQGKFLPDQSGADAGEDITHSTGRHAGIASRVVTNALPPFRNNGPAALQ